ncbi:MAG: hypothetical protein U1A78_05410 [Polyangia bacterium]
MRRRIPILTLVLVALCGLLFWFLSGKGTRLRSESEPESPSHKVQSQSPISGSRAPDPFSGPQPKDRSSAAARAERDALRDRIVAALAASPAASGDGDGGSALPAARRADAPRPAGTLRDRIGGRESLAKLLNHEFMPLADECIELAQRDAPELAGVLVIGLETAADQELGAVVEDVKVPATNQITDPELLTCIRETALSLRLPPPPTSGREKFEISLPIRPRAAHDL